MSRKDPAAVNGTVTVDVSLTEALPRGAVPDLGVDGTIELERIPSALQVAGLGLVTLGLLTTVGLFRWISVR